MRQEHFSRFGANVRFSNNFKRLHNDVVFSKIAGELAKCGYQRTVARCRGKIKALKNRYKLIRSGVGCESDEESEVPADFPYFSVLDAILGRRAPVTPVQLLNTAEVSEMLLC